ncbi:MAG: motility protein A [Nitrospiria bacterium]
MGIGNLIGVLICGMVFMMGFAMTRGAEMYLNIVALLVVISGTVGSAFLSYSMNRFKSALLVARNAYFVRLPSQDDIIKALLNMAVKSRYDGILSLEKALSQTSATFLRDALSMLVDGFKEAELKDVLMTETYFFKQRRTQNERVFRSMAKAAPAFGMIGSIIGLIGMLSGIGDTDIIIKTIPIALTSTLYGILLSSYCLIPIAENIHARTHEELLLQNMIVNGVLAISSEENTYKLEKKLCSFLTPSIRRGHQISFEDIRKRYLGLTLKEREEVFEAVHSI